MLTRSNEHRTYDIPVQKKVSFNPFSANFLLEIDKIFVFKITPQFQIRDDTHMASMKIFKTPIPSPVHLRPQYFCLPPWRCT